MSAYSTSSAQFRARLLTGCAIAAASMGTSAQAQRAFQATPTTALNAVVSQNTGRDTVTITDTQALIDWTPDAGTGTINILAAGDELRFQVDNADAIPRYTVLNRINPADPSRAVRIDGLVNSLVDTGYGISDGSIWFYTPGGIILGSNARFDVGSLVLTTNAIQIGNLDDEGLFVGQDAQATTGTIAFRGSADSKSFVTVEAGAKINATGSYVALVAPRVAQRGAITVNGSAALIAAESADVTIPVEGNLFDIAVFSGSKVDTAGEVTLDHSGSTEIADPTQLGDSRRIYAIAVPKNDAITMLVSGTVGYEAASKVTASSGRVILEAGTGVKISDDVVTSDPPIADTSVAMAGLNSTTSVATGGTFVSLDATAASSSFGGSLILNSGASSTITVANANSVAVGELFGGSAILGVAPSTVTVSSGGTLNVANDLSISSSIGAALGSDMALIVDNGTVEAGGSIFVRSVAGGSGAPGASATGGSAALAIRNDGIVTAGSDVIVRSAGTGSFGSTGGSGTGGSATVEVESGGSLSANSVTVESAGVGGSGGNGGSGQGGLASLTVSGGTLDTGYGATVRSRGSGGSSSNFGGVAGDGKAGTASITVAAAGALTIGSGLTLEASGDGASESGYGTGGAGIGGTATLAVSTGGIITADSLSVSVDGVGANGQRGGGAGSAGTIDIDLTGGSTLDAGTIGLSLLGSGGSGGSAAGGFGTGGTLTLDTAASILTFDQLTVSGSGGGGSSSSGNGGLGTGGTIKIALNGTTMAGANVISLDASGGGGEGFSAVGGSGKGGEIDLSVTQSTLASAGDISLVAKGFGDFGNGGGGTGKGGNIEFVASNAQVQASNINIDASGFGEQAFSTGSAGFGKGGAVAVTSTAGGSIKGLNTVRSDGRGGSAQGTADTGAGTGGAISIQAAGGSIDSTGATLTVSADGIGGRNEFGGAADALSRGGTIDIGIATGGELKLTSLKAQANGYFDDQPDGPVLNNGSTGVGGTVLLAMSGGTLTGNDVSLSANGRGAVSSSGGTGGTGYQGRAEVALTGGTATLTSLSVEALALGGQGFDQNGESGIDPGSGGAAGVGTSPFAGDAGAIVDVSGGALTVNSATVDGGSTGGVGGNGEEFADVSLTGDGGEAVGGVAVFTTSGTGSASVGTLAVKAIGSGGNGGGVFLFDSSGSDAVGGTGGAGTGGLVSITLGGTGALSFPDVFGDAGGEGGEGGAVRDFFESKIFGEGAGGQGGAAFGGGVNITVGSQLDDFAFFAADASALGGQGGVGPRGGSGGNATGGLGTIAVSAGIGSFGGLQVRSDGSGGFGAGGLSNDGGNGGDGFGGIATVTIGGSADLIVDTLELRARGFGGDGGAGADDSSFGYNGGNGGIALGGDAKITANGGRIRVLGGSEAPPVLIDVDATGGFGGSGGSASEGTGGTGGDGGGAGGGTATIASTDGDIDFFFTVVDANGTGGAGGSAGSGFEGVAGSPGFGAGGAIKINVDQTGVPGNSVRLGFAPLNANGDALGEDAPVAAAGYITFDVRGSSSGGALQFDELEANALGSVLPEDRLSGIKVRGAGSPITISGQADLFTRGAIDFAFSGNSGLRATGDLTLDTPGGITVAHSGQAAGGSFASLQGREVVANAGDAFDATATSRIDTTANLSVNVTAGNANIGSGAVGGSIAIDAVGDVTLGDGAQLVADRSVFFRSGDDIIIGTGALLRAAANPPAESGYGSTDPLLQQTQLKLYAGALFQGEGSSGDIRSLIINGDVESAARTMQLEAQAIQAADGTSLSGGNLYVRKLGTTPADPSDDFGQLAAPCLQGSVCLGNVNFAGIVQIGGSGFAPTNLRISGDLIGGSVFAGATDTVRLGREGVTTSISALTSLTIDARDGDLIGSGTINLTGGSQVVNLFAGGSIAAPDLNVTAPAGFDLVSGGDVILGDVAAPLIRTRDQALSVINPSGITADGLIQLASVETASDLLLDGQAGVTVSEATISGGKSLTVLTEGAAALGTSSAGTITVAATGTITADDLTATVAGIDLQSGGGDVLVPRMTAAGAIDLRADQGIIAVTSDIQSSGGITAEAKAVTLSAVSGLNVLSAKATAGDLVLSSSNGDLEAGTSSATGKISLTGAENLTFTSLTAGAGIEADIQGSILGGDIFAAGTDIDLTSLGAISLGTLVAQTSSLSATGDVSVAAVSVPGGISATGASVDLTAPGMLKVTLANATSGDVKLSAATDLDAVTVLATGNVDLASTNGIISVSDRIAGEGAVTASGKSITIDRLTAGAASKLTGTAGSVVVATDLTVGGDGLTASGEGIALTGLSGLNLAQLTASKSDIVLTSGGDIAFQTLSAAGDVALTASGAATGSSVAAGQSASLDADGGIDLASVSVNGPAVLKAANGAIVIGSASASDITASGRSLDITGSGSLLMSLAEATAGDAKLSAGGNVTVGTLRAAGQATLLAGEGDVTVADLVAASVDASGGSVDLTGSGDLLGVSARSFGGDITLIAQGAIGFDELASAGALDIASAGAITGGSASASGATTIASSGANVAIDSLSVANGAPLTVSGATGIELGSVSADSVVKLTSGGMIEATGTTAVARFDATGKSVALTGTGALSVSATATGGDLILRAAGPLTFDQLNATGLADLASQSDVTGGSITAGSILIVTPATVKADDLIATAGNLTVLTGKGVTLATVASTGVTTLKADQGLVTVTKDIRPDLGLVVAAPSIDLTAQNGLFIAQADATAGDLKLTTLSGDLIAGKSTAAGAIVLDSAGALSFTSLTAQQGVSVKAAGAVAGDTISSKAGAVTVTGAKGISLGSIAAAGPVTLGASAGSILVATDISASGPIQAAAQAISLTAINDLIVDKVQATGGDIILQSKNGALTIGQADATGALTAATPGLLTLTGNAAAATITFTSEDIAIGSGAQLGSKTLTTALTLTSTADRMFIGDATGTGYRVDTAELAKLGSKGDISLLSAPAVRMDQAFNLLDPAGTNIVVGALIFDGSQLGSSGTLRIASPNSIGFIGNSQFKNFTDGQTVTFAANGDISLAAETGLVTLKNSNGGLAGTLRLEAQQVHAMSTATRSEIAGLELNAVKQRLGTNDQVNNQGGYFQAGNIVVNIGRLLFIQNSGANGSDLAQRAGLTANKLTISSGEGGPIQIVLNGQVNGAGGTALRDNISFSGQIDPGSAFNGCAIGDAACGSLPPLEPVFDTTPVVSSARDQIEDEEDEDEKEEALQASQTRPDPIIQFMTPPSSRFDPLIDEPVTGAGNEDFWESPLVPSPGQNP